MSSINPEIPWGEVYYNCFSRWSRKVLPTVSSHLEMRRVLGKESFGGEWDPLAIALEVHGLKQVVFTPFPTIISKIPWNITVLVSVGLSRSIMESIMESSKRYLLKTRPGSLTSQRCHRSRRKGR